MAEKNQAFFVTLDDNDWRERLGGWDCAAARVPGASVSELLVNGQLADRSIYNWDEATGLVKWGGSRPPPKQVAAKIVLTMSLTTKSQAAWISGVLAVVAAVLGATISGVFSHSERSSSAPNITGTLLPALQCKEKLVRDVKFAPTQQVVETGLAGSWCAADINLQMPGCFPTEEVCKQRVASQTMPLQCIPRPKEVFCSMLVGPAGTIGTWCFKNEAFCNQQLEIAIGALVVPVCGAPPTCSKHVL